MRCGRCDQDHPRCAGHNKQTGGPCGSHPINGADKCRMHVGKKSKAVKQQVTAERAVVTYGLPREIDPHDALLQEVWRTQGHVEWLGGIISEIEQGDLVWGLSQEKYGGEDWGTTYKSAPNAWLTLYHQERTHLAKVCKAAIDAGIDERRVQLAEAQGAAIVAVLKDTLADLGVEVTPDVAATVGRHLRAVG